MILQQRVIKIEVRDTKQSFIFVVEAEKYTKYLETWLCVTDTIRSD